jgi:hypothetical protein
MLEGISTTFDKSSLKNCKQDCVNYLFVDPRPDSSKGIGPGTTGQRTLCSLLDDLNDQIMKKTEDPRIHE